MIIKSVFFLLLCVFSATNGLKIFGALPLGSTSHFAIGKSIIDALHEAGHDVTVLSPFPQKKAKERYRDIDLSELKKRLDKETKPNGMAYANFPVFMILPVMTTMFEKIVDDIMSEDVVKKFMASGEKFDVCIIELFYVEALLGFADHLDCVLISYTTFNAVGVVDQMTGNISPPSYVPMPFLDYTDKMTFIERFWNTIYTDYDKLLYNFVQKPLHRRVMKKHFPHVKRSLDEIINDVAIIFQNNHVSFSTPRPYLPNVIEICGIHVKPAQPLPKDLQAYMDDAKDGVIVFSMGSFINSKDFPVDKRDAFVNSFKSLKQKVVWKFEDELPNKPDNIRTEAWLPQRDMIAHKNVVLFITHGGLLGTTEAMYEGKPLLGIPIFGDQKMNMKKAVAKGYGLMVEYDEITEEKITSALKQLLNDPKYTETARVTSERFNDRPMTPKESVVYFTEYAYRHKGAKHLKGAGTELRYFQLLSIDVYAVLLAILILSIVVNYYIAKFIIRKVLNKFSTKQKKN